MADQTHTQSSGGSTGMAFIVGALVVAVGVLAWLFYAEAESSDDLTVTIEGGGSAIESVTGAVEDATN